MVGLVVVATPSRPVAAGSTPAEPRQRASLVDRIERIGIVDEVTEVPRLAPAGGRFFRIWFRLPVDHDRPQGRTFRLRAALVHRGTERPMVVATSGYGLYQWRYPYLGEVTRIVQGNQLDLEHRFFKPSRPARPDWDRQLTIEQSAADQHRIITAMKAVYGRRWLSTGASKGGMTMTYLRRFHPDDVAGTVAYVAPNDVVDGEDVYDDFQAAVGGADLAGCRADLVQVQRRILGDRAWFRDRLRSRVEGDGFHLRLVDSFDHALEVVVVELYFAFWQYQEAAEACTSVPSASATRRQVFDWVDGVLPWTFVTDEGLRPYVPYYFQAGTQLGSPLPYEDRIADLLRHPGYDVPAAFVPDGLKPMAFDSSVMADIDAWVREEGSRMLFVYGELDPWSAETFSCGESGADRQCLVRWVPDGNHGADLFALPAAARRAAVARVREWAGLSTDRQAVLAAERRAAPAESRVRAPGPRTAVPGP